MSSKNDVTVFPKRRKLIVVYFVNEHRETTVSNLVSLIHKVSIGTLFNGLLGYTSLIRHHYGEWLIKCLLRNPYS